MALDEDTVARVAQLARIKVAPQDRAALAGELGNIMTWIEQLNEVATDGVEPMASVVSMTMKMREDQVTDGGLREAVLKNGPDANEDFFTVPKVVE